MVRRGVASLTLLAALVRADDCTITPNVDFTDRHADIKLVHNVSAASDCCSPCLHTPGCTAFSFGFQGSSKISTCWLKALKDPATAAKAANSERTVGTFGGPFPTPPPTPQPHTQGPCDPGAPAAAFPFCNTSLPFEARAADLVSRIPPGREKNALLTTGSGGVALLGIAPFQWWSEGLHGVRCGHGINCKGADPVANTTTVFPQPIGAAAAFNRSLWHDTGAAIATEFRAFANAGRGFLSIFAPNINILRDARWGRGQVMRVCCRATEGCGVHAVVPCAVLYCAPHAIWLRRKPPERMCI